MQKKAIRGVPWMQYVPLQANKRLFNTALQITPKKTPKIALFTTFGDIKTSETAILIAKKCKLLQYWYSKGTVKSRFLLFYRHPNHTKKAPVFGAFGRRFNCVWLLYIRDRFALF